MSFALALIQAALIAGDPDLEWSTHAQPGASSSEAAPVPVSPAPAPPPAPARMSEETEIAQPGSLGRTALEKSFRAVIEADFGFSPSSLGQVGLGGELDWYPLRFLRLAAEIAGSWVPSNAGYGFSNRGAMKLIFGFDGVLPFTWGELFVGVQSGAAYTNATQLYGCFDCGSFASEWQFSPLMRVRGGFEVTTARPIVLGLDVGYMLFAKQFSEIHWAELHGRIGIAF